MIMKIGRAMKLTLVEQGKILSFNQYRLSSWDTATGLSRSKRLVNNFLKSSHTYNNWKGTGGASALTPQ